ncbi:F-box protein [Raphanus sativus]|uniref:F-box protein At2g32560 n=1 Tax=Raphanus sativus TaxID=3726 RepID=A0A6J0LT44_RAPSA|nr:F-box protein At2g32560 [Raphanus sativus]KAJ4896834.1 F-box protein [Raphanus sativus]
MLLYFLISCLSFFFLSKSLSLPPWASETKSLLSFYLSKNLLFTNTLHPTKPDPASPALEDHMSVLDLPDLALDRILDLLPPSGLSSMARVCSSLRERCVSDHLWEKHLVSKWGKILGPSAYREWKCYLSSSRHLDSSPLHQTGHPLGLDKLIIACLRSISSVLRDDDSKQRKALPVDSTMSFYISLETGRFWFPAQVYNRENGHVGFMLSCYDAELSYDALTDTFQARYPPQGRRAGSVEKGVTWERLRAAPLEASPHHLHVSEESLNELKPGDHIEIQWRRNKEFPYGWWYGTVGHLESCDGDLNHCHCHLSEMVVLEFNQYTVGSRWRRTMINKREHREEGNEEDGFYGGIRKLSCKEEIATWTRLWPSSILE